MLLVCDVGNTNIKFGIYDKDALITSFRIGTDKVKTSDEYGIFVRGMLGEEGISFSEISDVIISSVVPEVMHSIENLSMKFCNKMPYIVGQGLKTGLNIKYHNPSQVGADRVVNAVAAHEIYGGSLIILDLGTATTFCAVTQNADYLGGAIAPGIKISADALFTKTSMLPNVEIIKPESPLGKNTVWAIQSGLYYGYVGLIDNIIDKTMQEMNQMNEQDIKVIATGGMSKMMTQESKHDIIIDRELTLKGLKIIYDKNKK